MDLAAARDSLRPDDERDERRYPLRDAGVPGAADAGTRARRTRAGPGLRHRRADEGAGRAGLRRHRRRHQPRDAGAHPARTADRRLTLVEGNVFALPFADASFDGIVTRWVISRRPAPGQWIAARCFRSGLLRAARRMYCLLEQFCYLSFFRTR